MTVKTIDSDNGFNQPHEASSEYEENTRYQNRTSALKTRAGFEHTTSCLLVQTS